MILKNKSFGCKEKILREILEKNIIWEKSFIGQPCKTLQNIVTSRPPNSRCSFSMMVKWAHDGLHQANDGEMHVNDGEMSIS